MRVKPRLVLALLLVSASGTSAQRLEARIGLLATTKLVSDEGSGGALQRALNLNSSSPTELRLAPAPAVSILLIQSLRPRLALEAHGMFALSKLQAENADVSWDAQDVSMASWSFAVRYDYLRRLSLNAGIGGNHFFSDERGIFSDGSSIMPLVEAGAVTRPSPRWPVHLAARIQSHTFGTPALRRAGADDGQVLRLLLQVGFGR